MVGKTHQILVAERDQQVRELQQFFLEKAGFAVRFADDGEAALEQALSAKPDVVITEILIPKIDGLALCRRLTQNPATQHIPVIIFSTLSSAARASEAGAKAFLRKPFIESVFVDTIQNVIAAQPMKMEQQWASK